MKLGSTVEDAFRPTVEVLTPDLGANDRSGTWCRVAELLLRVEACC